MVVAAANLVSKHGINNLEIDDDYFGDSLHGRRRRKHEDDIISLAAECQTDADGVLKVNI